MTRREFVEDVNSFGDLISFCQDEEIYDMCEDVYDEDYANEVIVDTVRDMSDWKQIHDFLHDIPSGCDYYRMDEYGRYEDADEYFDDYKNDVLRYCDRNDIWDEEDEEDEYVEDDYDEPIDCTDQEEAGEDIETHSFIAVLGRAG